MVKRSGIEYEPDLRHAELTPVKWPRQSGVNRELGPVEDGKAVGDELEAAGVSGFMMHQVKFSYRFWRRHGCQPSGKPGQHTRTDDPRSQPWRKAGDTLPEHTDLPCLGSLRVLGVHGSRVCGVGEMFGIKFVLGLGSV